MTTTRSDMEVEQVRRLDADLHLRAKKHGGNTVIESNTAVQGNKNNNSKIDSTKFKSAEVGNSNINSSKISTTESDSLNERAPISVTAGQVRFAAMSLLARREHSRYELQQQLSRRFGHAHLIEEVLQQLADEALQSDWRFIENFVAMRVHKGQGPVRIEKELAERRVSTQISALILEEYRDQWPQLAKSVWLKKYGRCQPPTPQQQAKQTRFLLYRGFTFDQIQSIWNDA